MILASFLDQLGGHLCCGFGIFAALIVAVLYSIGSAAESICKSEVARDVAATGLEAFFESLFRR